MKKFNKRIIIYPCITDKTIAKKVYKKIVKLFNPQNLTIDISDYEQIAFRLTKDDGGNWLINYATNDCYVTSDMWKQYKHMTAEEFLRED